MDNITESVQELQTESRLARHADAVRKFKGRYLQKRIEIDQESIAIFFIILGCQLILPNGFYLFTCMAIIYLIIYNLQQPLKPGIFTFIALMHFLQIIAAVWQANSVGKDIN